MRKRNAMGGSPECMGLTGEKKAACLRQLVVKEMSQYRGLRVLMNLSRELAKNVRDMSSMERLRRKFTM